MNKTKRAIFTLLFLSLMNAAVAQEKQETHDAPAPPNLPSVAQRYIDFYSSLQLDFAIDPDSITIQPGAQKEVRYTLKATSKQGAINISYEGISCDNRQKIIYAVGRSDGSWSRARSPEWAAIYTTGLNLQHANLANGYFCSGNALSGDLKSILKRFETKQPLDAIVR
ncbi:CNP1-like family protein [Solimicrobium silvestre]|nr:CNP1-like family protein [Solimicrobium silvestre]